MTQALPLWHNRNAVFAIFSQSPPCLLRNVETGLWTFLDRSWNHAAWLVVADTGKLIGSDDWFAVELSIGNATSDGSPPRTVMVAGK